MKTYLRTKTQGQQGNTLMTTIMITGLIGFILAVYLTLVQSQNRATFRSQSWNMAMPVVEAGIEDALAHINANYEVGLERDGWTRSGNLYTLTRVLRDSVYTVRITNYTAGSYSNSSPIIESFGYVQMPGAMAKSSGALLATAGSFNATAAYLGRGVRVQAIPDFVFGRPMVAEVIDLNGNNISTDSFDSLDPRYSTNGLYWPGHTKDNGDIAVNSSLTNSLSIGNADIHGKVTTGPGGSLTIGPGGIVGDNAWHAAGNTGIQPGHSKDDMNVSFPPAKVPFTGGLTPSGGWLTNIVSTSSTNSSSITSIAFPGSVLVQITTNYPVNSTVYPLGSPGPVTTNWNNKHTLIDSYSFPTFSYRTTNTATAFTTNATYYDCLIRENQGGDYVTATLSGTVYIAAPVRMYVTTTLNISEMIIKPGGSLRLYTSAASASIAGNNSANSDGTADAFSYWGLPSNTSVSFSGNANFTGTIYAPSAEFRMNGSGQNAIDFVGASITKTTRLNGHFNFHYDEALARVGPFRGYIIDQWIEMAPSNVPKLNLSGYGSTGGTTQAP